MIFRREVPPRRANSSSRSSRLSASYTGGRSDLRSTVLTEPSLVSRRIPSGTFVRLVVQDSRRQRPTLVPVRVPQLPWLPCPQSAVAQFHAYPTAAYL